MALDPPLGESRTAFDAVARRVARVTTRRGVASPLVASNIFGQKSAPGKRVILSVCDVERQVSGQLLWLG